MVAPIALSSPLARAGFKIFAASIAPSLAPAPIRVCISSINKTISPSDPITSLTTLLSLSSNSPLYLAPAINAPMSKENISFDLRFSGTSPFIILCAKPSAMAVFPVPGSPINIGLFLVLLVNIWSILRISSSLPITGSNLPKRARSFKLRAYLFNALYVSSAVWLSTVEPLRNCFIAVLRSFSVTPLSFNNFDAVSFVAKIPSRICSIDTNWSLNSFK